MGNLLDELTPLSNNPIALAVTPHVLKILDKMSTKDRDRMHIELMMMAIDIYGEGYSAANLDCQTATLQIMGDLE